MYSIILFIIPALKQTSATWNNWMLNTAWSTAGADNTTNDREATDIGSLQISSTPTLNQFYIWTLTTSAIQDIADGIWTNNGFILFPDTENADGLIFSSPSTSTEANRPIMVVEYTEGTTQSFIRSPMWGRF